MRKESAVWVVATVIAEAALCVGDRGALAESGSTGGIIGKQDKAASGGEEPRHRSSRPSSPTGKNSACGKAGMPRLFVHESSFRSADSVHQPLKPFF
jgi:hypothetical protein